MTKVPNFNKADDFNLDQNFNYVQQLLQNLDVKDNVNLEVAFIKDEKVTNTAGGTFTNGAWRTRTLNTLEQFGSFVSLGMNQITLSKGTYEIQVSAPARNVDNHQARLRNITDNVTELVGSSVDAAAGNSTVSNIYGIVALPVQKTFEVQHRCVTTAATTGFGEAANVGEIEVYTQVVIRRLG